MSALSTLGDFGFFLGGVGVLLIGCGLMWFVSEWASINKQK
jgi:hypothetical protein